MTDPGRPARIAVHGAPRSGTTWVAEILNSSPRTVVKYQPLFSYALKDFLGPDSTTREIDAFFEKLETTADDFLDQVEQRADGRLARFEKQTCTHVVYKEVRYHHLLGNLMARGTDVRLVGCIRNPLSVINSWLRAPREFRGDLGWEIEEEWRRAPKKNLGRPEEFHGYERWKDAARILLDLGRAYPERVHLVEYRRLVAEPRRGTEDLFAFCGLEVEEPTRAFLERSTSQANPDAYSVFRSRQTDDAWKDQLDPAIAAEIQADLFGTALERFVTGEAVDAGDSEGR